jgi:hypothetical protein
LILGTHNLRKLDVGHRSIYLVDDLFDEQFIRMTHHFMSRLSFVLTEYDTEETKHTPHWKHEFDADNLPAPLMPALISRIVAVTRELYASETLELKRVHCNLHLYGDMQYPHTDLVPGVTALYFANPRWETNWMGETLFYDEHGEPLYAVIPKPGRLAIFSGDITHRGGVPSQGCSQPRISLALKFALA